MQQGKVHRPLSSAEWVESGTELFVKVLNLHGGRLTEERRELLKTVLTMKGHFDADEIHLALLKQGHQVSPATVYRNLALIVDAGIIRRVSLSLGDQSRMQFECILGKAHHDHLVCLGCGKSVEFFYPAIDVLQDAVASDHGFVLTQHHLELVGFCHECQEQSLKLDVEAKALGREFRLVDLRFKMVVRIVRLLGGKSCINQLQSRGLKEGCLIRLVRPGASGEPLLVEDMESHVKIVAPRDLAAHVIVQTVRGND